MISNPKRRRHMTKKVVSEPPRTSFFDLPRELRDQIYHEAWGSTKPKFAVALPENPYSQIAKVWYGQREWLSSGHSLDDKPPERKRGRRDRLWCFWFLGSKQLCVEALQQFQRGATWTFIGRGRAPQLERMIRGRWTAPFTRQIDRTLNPYLLTPSEAMDICIEKPLFMMTCGEIDGRGKSVKRVAFKHNEVLPLLPSNLINLHLHIDVEACGEWGSVDTIDVDFKPVQKLDVPNLQQLRFTLHFNDAFARDNDLTIEFQKAITRTGIELLSGSVVERCTTPLATEPEYRYAYISTFTRSRKETCAETGIVEIARNSACC
ncbi:hypothetical protein CC86DRAFT_377419 [Ophiobolus disseminans]|uniref:F-box domain-containing protein n=1 Tax=Ophiobolus disseminans TaxID=1469910 RepID=A0A6A7AI05_9PLEO|nr:hypothetical protein CC86DRAFT_377419 [Ophiobolus disseminans]